MFTQPLPVRPNLDYYRKLAKRILKAGEAATLTGAQLNVARSHGFASWPKFAKHVQALGVAGSPEWRFERAADAIVDGDRAALEPLLDVVNARSTREHRATLLHYVAANGVEDFRQKTPPNIVEIANLLLDAGADVNATAHAYGGEATTLQLAATSVHPERAGVQDALLGTLIGRGATFDTRDVRACLANGRLNAARFLADRGATLDFVSAAALGRLDLVSFDATQVDEALLNASEYAEPHVIELLLGNGANVAARDANQQTPLHRAIVGGKIDNVKLLLQHGAPLDAVNRWGGTPLGQAEWSGQKEIAALLST